MLQFTIIGNLGADAQIKSENGKSFVSFNVGHNDRWQGQDGVVHESTVWVSCALNGDGGGLLPYLRKGRTVFVQGRGSARVYSSEKARGYVAGLNISVDRLELIGANPDPVPRQLYTDAGVMVKPSRHYYVSPEDRAAAAIGDAAASLRSSDGRAFVLDDAGWVTPVNEESNEQ